MAEHYDKSCSVVQDPRSTGAEQRILDAAERCMARYGLRVSMRDVAAEAGLSRGSVYRYYADRDALVAAVLERTADRFVAAAAADVDTGRSLADQVAEAAVFIRRHLSDEGLTLRLPGDRESLLAATMSAGSLRLVERWDAFWLPRLAAARDRGEVRADLDHAQAAEWIVRLMLSFALLPSVAVDLDDADAVRTFVRNHLVPGFAPRPPARSPT
ncbi:MAG TPA: helix-turn-helix domain-containing protein [Acidimicrobiales bacterium]|nr:helix-turn-helix domain-containing protein [Acidimicrobiales bacterium]